jgi:hypothetical protein
LAHTRSSTAPLFTDSGQPYAHAAFIVRVWRAADDARWRVHLIEVASGERLACDAVAAVGECIAARLPAPPRRTGLR